MGDYQVHFSFYQEVWGEFQDTVYSVMAESPFEAREKAWTLCDEDEENPFRSNIKQFAVTWKPNLLDIGDYFYSYAADIKQTLGELMNIKILNDEMTGRGRRNELMSERRSELASLYTLNSIAKGLFESRGILPPSIYEELHYAEKLYEGLCESDPDKAEALYGAIKRAKDWDYGTIYAIRDLFQNGYISLQGKTEMFHEQFGRNGIYPVYDKPEEMDSIYVYRWTGRRSIDYIRQLPFFTEKDCIKDSVDIIREGWHYSVLNHEVLNEECKTPENMVWQVIVPPEGDGNIDSGLLYAENPITGQKISCPDEYFVGVLRPDLSAGIAFEKLKEEYAARQNQQREAELLVPSEVGDDELER